MPGRATRTVVVGNPEGLHARVAILIAEASRDSRSKVKLTRARDSEHAQGTDVLQILSLGAGQGEELVLEAVGEDADEVVETLARLFADSCGQA